jgi:hypothetical protein
MGRASAPALSLLDPARDQAVVGACRHEEVSGGLSLRLAQLALVVPQQDARLLGQEVGTVADYLAELSDRGGRLVRGGLTPAGMPLADTAYPGDEDPVTVRSGTILRHPAMTEHTDEKSNLARLIPA